MVKFITYCTKFVIATIAALSIASCSYKIDLGNSINGSGKIKTETRELASFTKVSVHEGLDCEIKYSDKQEVTVIADDNLINGIETKVVNGVLEINSEYDNYNNVSSKRIVVSMPKIEGIESTSGSSLKSINTLLGKNITVKSSSGSNLKATIEAETISLESSSGSDINVAGKALKLYTDASSGSHIDADEILANDVFSESSSGSSTNVHPIVNLNAKASSGSSINYNNTPTNIQKDESSGGSVSKD